MEKAKISTVITAILVVLIGTGSAWAVEVLEPDYVVETYASYSEAGLVRPDSMVFDPSGNLYVTQSSNGCIWIITSEKIASKFVSGFGNLRGIVWAGGTNFGEYLYVVKSGVSDGRILRIGLDGTVSTFASPSCPSPLGLDVIGNYGEHLFYATRCQDHTYRVNSNGGISMFSNFPGWKDGGGPLDISFDTTNNYENLMYMTVAFDNSHGNQHYSGLFSLDTGGNASRFADNLVITSRVTFDHVGYLGNKMFVIGSTQYDVPGTLWRVEPSGTITEFARTTASVLSDLEFGQDGAMYVAEYDDSTETVIISRIYPGEPPELTYLEVIGPDEVAENFPTQYKAIAHYDNNSTKDVTALANWFVEPNDIADVNAGVLTTEMIDLPMDLTITAEYNEGDVTKVAQKDVSILPICPSGSALEFDGQDDYVATNLLIDQSGSTNITMAAWVYPTSLKEGIQQIISTDNGGHDWSLLIRGGKWQVFPGYYSMVSEFNVDLNRWQHVAAVFDVNDKKVYFYKNGVRSSVTSELFTDTSTNHLCMGDNPGWWNEYFEGAIDEVAIYNRALSAEDIRGLMHIRPEAGEPNLVGYWNFDEGSGQYAYDSSGNSNDGQLGSTPDTDSSDPNWVDSDAPVGICTLDGLVGRNISNVLDIKAEILDLLDIALGKEDALLDYMDDAFHNGQLDNLNKGDVVKAKQKIMGAIQQEEQAETAVDQSIDKLGDALNTLGLELNSQE